MSVANVSIWKLGLKHLRQLAADPRDSMAVDGTASDILHICNEKLNMKEAMSESTCRNLVHDLKWPLHACTAVAQAAQQHPRSAAIYAAVKMLEAFFSTAEALLLEGAGHTPVASLQASVQQQVEQSGLLQQLPALMIAAAVELAAQAKDRAFAKGFVPKMLYACSIRQHASQLLNLFCHVGRLWASDDGLGRLKVLAGPASTTMQLSLAATRNISAEVQEHMHNPGGSHSNTADMQLLMKIAYWSMRNVALIVDKAEPGFSHQHAARLPQVSRLLLGPQLVPCFVLQLTITALAVDMIGQDIQPSLSGWQDDSGGSGSFNSNGSSGGGGRASGSNGTAAHKHRHSSSVNTAHHHHHHHSSSSSGSGGGHTSRSRGSSSNAAGSNGQARSSSNAKPGAQQQQQQQAAAMAPPGVIPSGKCPCCLETLLEEWRLACEWHSSLTPCHHKLFELLGVDASAVLWAAAVNRSQCTELDTYASVLTPYIEHAELAREVPLQRQPAMVPRQQLERQLHLLLPPVLMHHAAALPAEHVGFTQLCMMVAQLSTTAVSVWEHLLPVPADVTLFSSTGELLPYRPPDTELGQLLRLGCMLSASLQQHLRATADNAAAAAAAGFVPGLSGLNVAQLGAMHLAECMCRAMKPAVWVEPVMCPAVGTDAVLPAESATAAAVGADSTVLPAEAATAAAVLPAEAASTAAVQPAEGATAAAVQPAEGATAATVLPAEAASKAAVLPVEGATAAAEQIGLLPEPQCGLYSAASLRDQAVGVMATLERYIRSVASASVVGHPLRSSAESTHGHLIRLVSVALTADGSSMSHEHPDACAQCPLVALAAAAGPGSAAQRQLYGLLTSALKLVCTSFVSSAQLFGTVAASCAWVMLGDMGAAAASAVKEPVPAASVEGGSSSSSLAPGVVYLGLMQPPPPSAAACDALDQLPWAVLQGRCCLLWAQQLEQEIPRLLVVQQQLQQQEGGGQLTWQQVAELGPSASSYVVYWCLAGDCSLMDVCAFAAYRWLENPQVADRLSAAGYQPQQVLEALTQLLVATQAAAEDSAPVALQALVETLQAAGQALCCLATRLCCNNPCCGSMAGATELQLVSGKGCICAGCRTARYCDRACQRAHWKRHKPVCQALAAAAAAKQGADAGSSSS